MYVFFNYLIVRILFVVGINLSSLSGKPSFSVILQYPHNHFCTDSVMI